MSVEERLRRTRAELSAVTRWSDYEHLDYLQGRFSFTRLEALDLLHLVDIALDPPCVQGDRAPLDEGQAVRSGDGIRIYEEHAWEGT